jgi:hypothetical protein
MAGAVVDLDGERRRHRLADVGRLLIAGDLLELGGRLGDRTLADAFTDPALAVTCALPGPAADTRPLPVTVTTAVLSDAQVIDGEAIAPPSWSVTTA